MTMAARRTIEIPWIKLRVRCRRWVLMASPFNSKYGQNTLEGDLKNEVTSRCFVCGVGSGARAGASWRRRLRRENDRAYRDGEAVPIHESPFLDSGGRQGPGRKSGGMERRMGQSELVEPRGSAPEH